MLSSFIYFAALFLLCRYSSRSNRFPSPYGIEVFDDWDMVEGKESEKGFVLSLSTIEGLRPYRTISFLLWHSHTRWQRGGLEYFTYKECDRTASLDLEKASTKNGFLLFHYRANRIVFHVPHNTFIHNHFTTRQSSFYASP